MQASTFGKFPYYGSKSFKSPAEGKPICSQAPELTTRFKLKFILPVQLACKAYPL